MLNTDLRLAGNGYIVNIVQVHLGVMCACCTRATSASGTAVSEVGHLVIIPCFYSVGAVEIRRLHVEVFPNSGEGVPCVTVPGVVGETASICPGLGSAGQPVIPYLQNKVGSSTQW